MKWEMVKLGDVINIAKGKKHNPLLDGKNRYINIEDLHNPSNLILTNDDGTFVSSSDLIIAWDGANAGKVGVGYDGVIGSTLARLRLNRKDIDSNYLFWYLESKNSYIKSQRTGATIPHVNGETLKQIQIPLPPLTVQKEIAEILDTADALRKKDNELLKKYDELAQSIFIEMFGDPVRNEKGWEVFSFESLFDSRLGKMLDVKKQIGKTKYKYLGNSNVQWFRLELSNLAEMEFDQKEIETLNLKDGDILICEGGDVGRCAVWKSEMDNVYFQKAIHRARPRKDNILPSYLARLFWNFSKYGGFKDFVSTSTISHLTGEKLKTIPIPLPPIALQIKYDQIITNLNKQKNELTTITHTNNLFHSLLQKAFKGELT